ncbi:SOS response-associated peptidase [Candidatus Deferrimicrobium sp.]|jgi:putative SOS response-associated peptidase YedK|uniref:SOS response-associated peptidase n=1 Tax=Candidatus Deferrimicrobium sp. TaxID=3060586 RepID=UPI003C57C4E8
MCGRFTLFEPDKVLAKEFGVSGFPPRSLRYNIAPSQPIAAVRAVPTGSGRELALLRWGLIPSWSKDPAIGNRLINARAETAPEKPSFRNAFRRHRCLIPTSGFYEWLRWERGKQPYFVRMRDSHPFAFAGLWDRWESPEEGAIETCTILTTAANAVLAPIHDRMPVILPPWEYSRWLDPSIKDPDSLAPLLVPFPPEEMLAYPVNPRVNVPSADDKGCIAPLP